MKLTDRVKKTRHDVNLFSTLLRGTQNCRGNYAVQASCPAARFSKNIDRGVTSHLRAACGNSPTMPRIPDFSSWVSNNNVLVTMVHVPRDALQLPILKKLPNTHVLLLQCMQDSAASSTAWAEAASCGCAACPCPQGAGRVLSSSRRVSCEPRGCKGETSCPVCRLGCVDAGQDVVVMLLSVCMMWEAHG